MAGIDSEQLIAQPHSTHRLHLAELPARDQLTQRLDHRVVAISVAEGMDQSTLLGQPQEHLGVGERRAQRLLRDDVLAGIQRGPAQREMQHVGRTDVDDIDSVAGDQLLGAGKDLGHSEPRGVPFGDLARSCRDPRDLDADPAQRVNVEPSDTARADDPSPDQHSAVMTFTSACAVSSTSTSLSCGGTSRCTARDSRSSVRGHAFVL